MFQYKSKTVFSKWPETLKLGFLALFTALAFFQNTGLAQFGLFIALVFLLLLAKYRDFWRLFLAIAPFLAVTGLMTWLFLFEIVASPLEFLLVVSLRVVNVFLAIAFFSFTTDLFALVKLLKKARFPEEIFLPFYVLLRFLPELERDFYEIRAIQKTRGFSRKRPLVYLKAVLVPLFITALDRAEQISIAYFLRKKRGF